MTHFISRSQSLNTLEPVLTPSLFVLSQRESKSVFCLLHTTSPADLLRVTKPLAGVTYSGNVGRVRILGYENLLTFSESCKTREQAEQNYSFL